MNSEEYDDYGPDERFSSTFWLVALLVATIMAVLVIDHIWG